mmetsp:Transcript_10876/g.19810  ORF Transcript_10876/g.19810 Transcript_10876/m.19810 type:complete len:234 (+) Transcript_10876:139-840(+)
MFFIIKAKSSVPSLVQKLSIAIHVSVFCITLSMCLLMFKNSLFSWHPICMSIGYILFMTEGVLGALLFRQLEGLERVKAIQAHAYMQLRAIVFIFAGATVIIYNKIRLGKMHFKSNHAKIGLASLILAAIVPLGGAISFRKLGFIHYFPERLHPFIKASHRYSGMIAWILALVAIEIILPHKAVYRPYITKIWQVSVALLLAVSVFIAVRFTQPKVKTILGSKGGGLPKSTKI